MDHADRIVERVGQQMARAQVVLFTGAGFSFGATDGDGQPIPQVKDLKTEIWEMIWPGDVVPDESNLPDTYAAALTQGRNKLKDLMLRRLRVA
jgi:hypothetical protein